MAYQNGKTYYIIPTCATGDAAYNQKILNKEVRPLALNTAGVSASHYNKRNVNVYSLDWSADMQWKVELHSGFARILCAGNPSFGLDYYYGNDNAGNCDIYQVSGNDEDSKINFRTINASENLYKLQCYRNNVENDLYLTVMPNSSGAITDGCDVRWQPLDASKATQQTWWLVPIENVSSNNSSGDNPPSSPSNTVSINLRHKISSYNQRADSKYEFACAGVCGCMAINTHPDAVPENYIIPQANWNAIASLVGKTADPQNDTSLVNILNLLQQEYPVIVRTRTEDTSQYGQHWVIIYGYSGSATNVTASGFMCIDPYGANTTDTFGKDCSLVDSSHFVAVTRRVHFM